MCWFSLCKKQNIHEQSPLYYRTHGVTCQQACIHVLPLPNLVFWEQTNCTRTEIELRSLNVLPERRPQHTTHLPTPCCFYFSDFLYVCYKKSADAEWKCHILNSPESPKSIQLWNLKYLGLCVCDIPFISLTPVTRSSRQVAIMCRAWYLQLWWQEN